MPLAGVLEHGTMKRNRNEQFADTVELFLQNVGAARMSNSERLQFATGSRYYPNTIRGLVKKAVRQIKMK